MNRSLAWGIAAMAAIVVASNVLVQFLVGSWLTWAAFVYPFAFLVTDIMNRVYGVRSARKVVVAGFAVGVLCSLAGSFLDGPDGPLVTLRIALGSGAAFLAAQLLDIFIFDKLRDREWWKARLSRQRSARRSTPFCFSESRFPRNFLLSNRRTMSLGPMSQPLFSELVRQFQFGPDWRSQICSLKHLSRLLRWVRSGRSPRGCRSRTPRESRSGRAQPFFLPACGVSG